MNWHGVLSNLPEAVLRDALDSYFAEDSGSGPVSCEAAIWAFLDNLGDSSKEDALDSVFSVVSALSRH